MHGQDRPGVEAAVVPTKPYDWTYTTLYAGHTEAPTSPPREWAPADPANPAHTIPLAELTRPDPILFYAEVPLFESELDDNGASTLLVRIVRLPVRQSCLVLR
jgi:type 2A phosphatase activator TIP41